MPPFDESRKFERLPICLESYPFARTCNNIIEIGRVFELARASNREYALDMDWTSFFVEHFDSQPDILFDYHPYGECESAYDGEQAFYNRNRSISHLVHLPPKEEHRQQAESIIRRWGRGNRYISVHRRDMEGSCLTRARQEATTTCPVDIYKDACTVEYDMVPNPENWTVVLFTDKQVPEKDNTFPITFVLC